MRYGWLEIGSCCLLLAWAAGCGGGDSNSGASCGKGTHLEGSKCVAGAGGAAGADAGTGGTAGAAGASGTGGTAGASGTGGAAGASGAGGAGGSAGAGGSGGVSQGKWLAFTQASHTLVVDTHDLGSLTASDLGPSSAGNTPYWSPNGQRLLFADPTTVKVAEVGDSGAGTAFPVFTYPAGAQYYVGWSSDSQVVVILVGHNLRMAVAQGPAPVPKVVSQQAQWFRLSPTRPEIAWINGVPTGNEVYVAGISGGNLATPRKVGAAATGDNYTDLSWSDDGNRLIMLTTKGVDITDHSATDSSSAKHLADLTNPSPGIWSADLHHYSCFVSTGPLAVALYVVHVDASPPTADKISDNSDQVARIGPNVLFDNGVGFLAYANFATPLNKTNIGVGRFFDFSPDAQHVLATNNNDWPLFDVSNLPVASQKIVFSGAATALEPAFSNDSKLLGYIVNGTLWAYDLGPGIVGNPRVLVNGASGGLVSRFAFSRDTDRIGLSRGAATAIAALSSGAASAPLAVTSPQTGTPAALEWQP